MARRTLTTHQAARQQSTLEGWLSAQGSPNTRAAYRADLRLFETWCSQQVAGAGAEPITANALRRFYLSSR